MLQTDLIQDFHHHRNSTEPRVQFTLETECQFALLDVQVAQNPDRSIDTSVHRTSNTKKYLNSTSHHPLAHKIAVERTLHSRAHTLASSAVSRFQEELNTRVLAQNSYPARYIQITPSQHRIVLPRTKIQSETPPLHHNTIRKEYLRGYLKNPYHLRHQNHPSPD